MVCRPTHCRLYVVAYNILRLKFSLLTQLRSSLPFCPYQRDEFLKPLNLLTELCNFSLKKTSVFNSPLVFPVLLLFYWPSCVSVFLWQNGKHYNRKLTGLFSRIEVTGIVPWLLNCNRAEQRAILCMQFPLLKGQYKFSSFTVWYHKYFHKLSKRKNNDYHPHFCLFVILYRFGVSWNSTFY